jgi:energy-converting hydrogenase Eha subunit F
MNCPSEQLTEYQDALRSGIADSPASEHAQYLQHTKALEEITALISQSNTEGVLALLEAESRNFGWSFLSGPTGERAEMAFTQLAKVLRSHCA